MNEEKYQKELFEFEKPKRFFPKLSAFFPKGDFERNVILTLTLDRAVFIAIGIIMVMVAIYAIGIEAGKTRTLKNTQPPAPAAAQAAKIVPAAAQVVKTAPVAQAVVAPAAAASVVQAAKIQASPTASAKAQSIVLNTAAANSIKKNPAPADTGKPYTIVAATFTRKDTAVQETDKLKKLGFSAVIVQSGRYFQACVGAYADKAGTASQKDLKKVRRLYKDAYIKLK